MRMLEAQEAACIHRRLHVYPNAGRPTGEIKGVLWRYSDTFAILPHNSGTLWRYFLENRQFTAFLPPSPANSGKKGRYS